MGQGTVVKTQNPATEETLNEYSFLKPNELAARIARSEQAFRAWRLLSFRERGELFLKLAIQMKREVTPLAQLITNEMGKIQSEAIAEIDKCISACQYYADESERMLAADLSRHAPSAKKSFVAYEPLGTIFGILPWNYPFWQVFRFAVPTLMAGNSVVYKHAPNTFGCGEHIEKLFKEAGFPEGLVQHLKIDVTQVESVIATRAVKAVSLTGSTRAGRSVAEIAGRNVKKSVLELGGSDPYVVLDDADLDLAARVSVQGRMMNAGQSCVAAKRFIVTQKNADVFIHKVLSRIRELKFGDPNDKANHLGPLARRDLREHLHSQVLASVQAGAKLVVGGSVPDRPGFFYPPTLLLNVTADQVAFREELFGPVAAVIVAKNEDEALRLAVDTDYGLGCCVLSSDLDRAERIARDLPFGLCFVNGFVRSDIRLPFGGVNLSGYGRELGASGIHEFVNTKTVVVY